jgi:methylmalonyl-CoA/ethylmalonyl-CoA epimerase
MIEFHHIGVLVNSIDKAIESYKVLFPKSEISQVYFVSSQKVNVCFVTVNEHTRFELVESISPDSAVHNLKTKGFTYYHVGYLTNNIDDEILNLESHRFKLLSKFNSEAFDNRLCAFLISADMSLIELIQS